MSAGAAARKGTGMQQKDRQLEHQQEVEMEEIPPPRSASFKRGEEEEEEK